MRKVEEPTEVQHGDRIIKTHPAYAQISATRVTGTAALYGSEFLHQNFIRIRIAQSELHRSLSNDDMHPATRPYIEVDMSEAQWATFVSNMNSHGGAGCTLVYKNGEPVVGLPRPVSKDKQFKDEAAIACSKSLESIRDLKSAIDNLPIALKHKSALVQHATTAERSLLSTVPFILEQFGEYMEKTVEKAKVEIHAYANNEVKQAGMQALGISDNMPFETKFIDVYDK